jgi:hypothetical protein
MPSWRRLRTNRDATHDAITTIEELQRVPSVDQGAGLVLYELRATVRRGDDILFTLNGGPVPSAEKLALIDRLTGEVTTRLAAGA